MSPDSSCESSDGRTGGLSFQGAEVRVPDPGYWKAQVNCQRACPVHTDARGYIRAVAAGRLELAYLIARGPNPLASVCGQVCGAPCENACRRGAVDQPVAIRALKRFVCEQAGHRERQDGFQGLVSLLRQTARRHAGGRLEGEEEILPLLQACLRGNVPPVQGRSVAVVGSGPAGLAAAHDLMLLGFAVTVYEMEPVLAGMLFLGIPEYRLPRAVLESELAVLRAMGMKEKTGCEVGVHVTLPEIRSRHDVTVIAVGAKRSRRLPVPGADAWGVMGGVEFLRDVALGNPVGLADRVVVIGGGNVAFDVGRTVLRQTSLDAARTALRGSRVSKVTISSLETLREMPADDQEIREGEEEGIVLRNGMGPVEILTRADGRVRGVLFRKCLRVYDEQRRFAPVFDDRHRETIPCEHVILAIGQEADIRFVDAQRDGIRTTDRGWIACDADTGRTSAPDVFVAGDLAHGPKLLIHAVASGKRVARAVYQAVTGRRIRYDETVLHLADPGFRREAGYESLERTEIPCTPAAERLSAPGVPVERTLDADQARREASRCLDCAVNTRFHGERCILCGGCVDVCPHACLRIVSLDRMDGVETLPREAAFGFGGKPPDRVAAILKDETRCIRCGLCAERCPSGAVSLDRLLCREVPTCRNP